MLADILGVYVRLPDYLVLPKIHEGYNWFELCTKLYINYSDMFNRTKYQYILNIKHKVIIDNIETETPDVPSYDYQYVKVHYEPYEIMPIKMSY